MKPLAFASLPLACGTIALMSVSTAASAADLSVCAQGCTFASIQAAVNAANSGDKINIRAGTYFENVVIPSKGLTLIGAGKDLTTVDGGFKNPVFTLGTPGTISKQLNTLIGMTITHGLSAGGFGGGGVSVRGGFLVMQDSIVSSNRSSSNGGGIDISSHAVGIDKFHAHQLSKTMFTHNGATLSGGGVHLASDVEIIVLTSTIARNTAGACGGGVATEDATFFGAQNVSITDNIAGTDGGGVCRVGAAGGGFNSSVIANNQAARDGGGLFGGASLGSSTVSNNTAGHDGGGISATSGAILQLEGGDFVVSNTAAGQGGGVFADVQLLGAGETIANNKPDNCVDAAGGCPP